MSEITIEVTISIEVMAEAPAATRPEGKGKQGVIIPYTHLYADSGTTTPVPMVADAKGGIPAGPVLVMVR